MTKDGLENVRREKVMVPHWVRGAESLELVAPRRQMLPMLGLGGSIATPPGGITAEVMVVASFEELTQRAGEAKGKIVLYDAEWRDYGYNGAFRRQGAIAAAKAGAVASLARSRRSVQHAHAAHRQHELRLDRHEDPARQRDGRRCDDDSPHDQSRREGARDAHDECADAARCARAHNVMGELRGREKPEEIVVMGGHIDSWDVGQGAMDDAGGVVVAWEAIRLLKKLGLTPRRTIRVVGWTNEENGGRGGAAYRDTHQKETHQLAIESDGGVFSPLGFGFTGSPAARAIIEAIGGLLEADRRRQDRSVRRRRRHRPDHGDRRAGHGPQRRWHRATSGIHHTDADTPDKLDPAEVQRCVAAMAVMAYIAADIEQALPR